MGRTPCKPKSFSFYLLLDTPTQPKNWGPVSFPWSQTTYWKKGISNSIYTNFTKMLSFDLHFQLHNNDLFEELLGIKSHHTRQCPAGFPLRIILLYIFPTKNAPSFGKTLRMGEGGGLLIFSTRNRNFHVILFASFICISSHFCCIIFQLLCTHISTSAWHWMVKIHLIEICITPIF